MFWVAAGLIACFVCLHDLPAASHRVDAVTAVQPRVISMWVRYSAYNAISNVCNVFRSIVVSCRAVEAFEGGANFRAPCEMTVTLVHTKARLVAAQALRGTR